MTTKKQFAARQRYARVALGKLESGAVLDAVDRQAAAAIIRETLNGIDVREHLGIDARKPTRTAALQRAMALHYWTLRLTEPNELDVVARRIVEKLWGCSGSRVYQIAQPKRAECVRLLRGTTREQVIASAEILAPEYRRVSAK